MVVCVELQKLGSRDGAANATNVVAATAVATNAQGSHKTFTSGFLPINWANDLFRLAGTY